MLVAYADKDFLDTAHIRHLVEVNRDLTLRVPLIGRFFAVPVDVIFDGFDDFVCEVEAIREFALRVVASIPVHHPLIASTLRRAVVPDASRNLR